MNANPQSGFTLWELLMTMLLGVEDAETLTAVGQIHLGDERVRERDRLLRRW